MSQQSYTVRPGTIDFGKEYEWKIIALLALRLVHQSKEDWWIASNVEGVGAFDDVILHRGGVTYMLQLKHKEDSSAIKPNEFWKKSDKSFNLEKYVEDINKLKENLDCKRDQSEFVKQLGKFNNIYFLLYTNRGVPKCDILEKYHNEKLLFLNTVSKSDHYKFNLTKLPEPSSFSNKITEKFILLANQIHIKNIDEAIIAEINKILVVADTKNVATKFTAFIEQWLKGLLGGHYFLTKNVVLWKLTELFLNTYHFNLEPKPFTCDKNNQTKIWNEIVSDKTITFVDSDEEITDFLSKYVGSEVGMYYSGEKWSDCLSDEEQNLFYQISNNLPIHMYKIVGNSGKITLHDFYTCLWTDKKLPLLLEVDQIQNYYNILEILKLTHYSYKVILINKCETLSPSSINVEANYFCTLKELGEEHRDKILKLAVKLQGRPKAILGSLVDRSMFHHISCKDVIKILQNKFNIGNSLKLLPDYHIERELSQIYINLEILDEICKDIFVIQTSPEINISKLLNHHKVRNLEEDNLDELDDCFVIVCAEIPSEKRLSKLQSLERPVHWFTACDHSNFKWEKSYGSIESLRKFLVDSVSASVDDFIHSRSNATTIVTASPGMGKTILMDYVALKTPTDKWVLRINLNAHGKYYTKDVCKTEETPALAHLQYFSEKCSEDYKLGRAVFEKLQKQQDIVVLLDGYDEVSICYEKQVTNIAKSLQREGYTIWLTTRPFGKLQLEEELNTLSTTLIPFTNLNQEQFLLAYFRTVNKDIVLYSNSVLENFVQQLLNLTKKNLNDRDAEFTGIPLQCELLGEYFKDDCRRLLIANSVDDFTTNFNLLYLYENFINRKIDILLEKFGTGVIDMREMFLEDQSIFALKVLFPQHASLIDQHLHLNIPILKYHEVVKNLQKDGILTLDEQFNVNFVHRTFAEFIVATWLTENFNCNDAKISELLQQLLKERFSGNYRFMFNIFDRLLAQGCPVHLAIINNQAEVALNLMKGYLKIDFDKGKRSFLHLVALYSPAQEYAFSIKSERPIADEMLNIIKNTSVNMEIVKTDLFGFNPFEYAILNRSLYIANEICKQWMFCDLHKVASSLKQYDLTICMDFKYTELLGVFMNYYVYKDLLFARVHKDTSVHKYMSRANDSSWNRITSTGGIGHSDTYKNISVLQFLNLRKANNFYLNLTDAVVFGTKENVQLAISNGEDVNKKDIHGKTPLHYAILHNKIEVADMLFTSGAKVDGGNVLHLVTKALSVGGFLTLNKPNRRILNLTKFNLIPNHEKDTDLSYLFENCYCNVVSETSINGAKLYLQGVRKLPIFDATQKTKGKQYQAAVLNFLSSKNDNNIPRTAIMAGNAKIFRINQVAIKQYYVTGDDIFRTDQKGPVVYLGCYKVVNTFQRNINKKICIFLNLMENQTSMMKLLSSQRIDVNATDKKGRSVLHLAVNNRLMNVIDDILEEGDINIQDENGNTALHLSLMQKQTLIAKLLISRNANIDLKNKRRNTALHCAIENDLEEVIPEILNKMENVNQQNLDGNTCLHLSVMKKSNSISIMLLSSNADVNVENHRGQIALHQAVQNRLENVILEIIHKTKNINKQDFNGNTCLHLSLMLGSISISRLLLSSNADVNLANGGGDTALHCAVKKCSELLSTIVLKTDDINKKDVDGNTGLHLSLMQNSIDISKLLLSSHADVNVENEKLQTALHCAVENALVNVIPNILSRTKNINKQDSNGNTCLHLSLMQKSKSIPELLLSSNADVNIVNGKGCIALHYAVKNYLKEFIPGILHKTQNINEQDVDGNTCLHLALTQKSSFVTKFLLSANADVNVNNRKRQTALHCAVQNCIRNQIKGFIPAILTKTSNINSQDVNGDTCLHLATMNNDIECIQLLLDYASDISIKNNKGISVSKLGIQSRNYKIASLFKSKSGDQVGYYF